MSLAAAAAVVGGAVPASFGERAFERVTTDSRSIRPRDLFVALKGERFDGHDFVAAALRKGAAGALVDVGRAEAPGQRLIEVGAEVGPVVSKDVSSEVAPCIAVRDTRLALGQLARSWRARFTLPLIAVAGSNGKTTVTQMIASILRAHAGAAAFHTEGNFNNDIGLPLTLLRLCAAHRVGVIELGMNHRGEIAYLAGIARPTIALVNNAQREHQEFLQSVADVAAENASLYDFLAHDGIAIVNADDDYAQFFVDRAGGRRVVTFGMRNRADVRVSVDEATFGSRITVQTPLGAFETMLRIAGRHNALNAAAAVAASIAADIPLPEIERGLQAFTPVAGRLVKTLLESGAVVLDDTYNANPDSVRAAIDVLHGIAGRRVLVLGPMAEVGDHGAAFHREVGAYAKECGIEVLLTVGADTQPTIDAFGHAGTRLPDIDALIAVARDAAASGSTLLVKGSRSARMERVVRALTGQPLAAEGAH